MADGKRVFKAILAEQMSVQAMQDFASSETQEGRPTYIHTEEPKGDLPAGMHYIYKPDLAPEKFPEATKDGTIFALGVRPKIVPEDTDVDLVVRGGTGVGNLEKWWKADENRIGANTPGQNAKATAEYASKALIRLVAPTFFDKASDAVNGGSLSSKDLSDYTDSRESNGKKLVIAGMGDIGIEVAKLMKPWMNLTGWGYTRGDGSKSFPEEKATKMGIGHSESVEEAMKTADAITIHISGTDEVIGRKELETAKKGIFIVNAARAECVNPEALEWGIKEGIVGGFVIDADRFTILDDGEVKPDPKKDKLQPFIDIQNKFPGNENLIVTPHFGGDVTMETNYNVTTQTMKQISAAVWDGKIINPVKFGDDRPILPEGYTNGGVEKPHGVGEIDGMTPSASATDVEGPGKGRVRG